MYTINILNVIYFILFLLPVVAGAYKTFAKDRIEASLITLFESLEYLVAMLISLWMTRRIFFTQDSIFKIIRAMLPKSWNDFLGNKDLLTYIIVVPIMIFLILIIFRIILAPVYQNFVIPASDNIKTKFNDKSTIVKGLLYILYQSPKSIFVIVFYSMILSFYTYYNYSPKLAEYMSDSAIYRFVYSSSTSYLLSPNITKSMAIINNGAFGNNKTKEKTNESSGDFALTLNEKFKDMTIKDYLNGNGVKDIIKSVSEIDNTTNEVAGKEKSSRNKAKLIYNWVTKNIKYDEEKAIKVSKDSKGIASGAVIAYTQKKGICFDFAGLYYAMCKSAGLDVRFVTGMAYNGMTWGDHAWNQVYIKEEKKWINVDTTFGLEGNYFEKDDFYKDHANEKVAEVK